MPLGVYCIRTTLAVSVAVLALGACGYCVGDSCFAESAESPGCNADCMEEAAGADVVLLQNGLRLEGGAGHALQKSTGDKATTDKAHTGALELSSVRDNTYEMEEYDINASLTCENATKCTCSRVVEPNITEGAGLDNCKAYCLSSSECVAIYCEGDDYDFDDCRCHQYSSCNSTRVPVHNGVTYKKTEVTTTTTTTTTTSTAGLCSGSTTAGSTNWANYSSNGIYVDVDTSICGFSATPVYVTSMGGKGHFTTSGSSEVYDATDSGFRIYIYKSGVTAEYANEKNWHINWVAHPDGRQSDSSSASCAGETVAGSTTWIQYNTTTGGIYVDVDTSNCNFSATPVYITSLGGRGHFTTTGSSEVYDATKDSFRIYIYEDSITPEEANEKDWHVNWVAQPSGQQDHGDGVSCAGESGSTGWVQYSTNGIYVDVDTSSCGFVDTPVLVTSMGGRNHWLTSGSSEPYLETASGFRIYIYQSNIEASDAVSGNWSVNWIADQA